ncbi:MAG: hypothetical protein PHT40_00080 [Patescibacteria group bacterium]|nr:hypothetical protein [Patescibacteria group bacterium]
MSATRVVIEGRIESEIVDELEKKENFFDSRIIDAMFPFIKKMFPITKEEAEKILPQIVFWKTIETHNGVVHFIACDSNFDQLPILPPIRVFVAESELIKLEKAIKGGRT